MTYKACFLEGEKSLQAAGVMDASIDARLLLEYVCHTTRQDMIMHGDREVTEEEYHRYSQLISKRSARIPLQHLTGEQSFMGYEFKVNEHVLIPRQDTEILVEQALKYIKPGMQILDMCTGSGCILLSLLAYSRNTSGVGVDISAEALEVSVENLQGISGQCGKSLDAVFVESNLFEKLEGTYDVIVSNPPYIASAVIETLEPEVRIHEPIGALDGTEDGLYFYREIVAKSWNYLKEGGALLFEIGYDQGESVANLMKERGYKRVAVRKDYAGLDRVVYGIKEET